MSLTPERGPCGSWPLALLAWGAMLAMPALAADASEASVPVNWLKLAPDLSPPQREVRARPGAAVPAAPRAPREDRVLFLRADMLEGKANDHVDASGQVELRTRTETVLADWLRYDFDSG